MVRVQLQLERVQIEVHSDLWMNLLWLLPGQTDGNLAGATKAVAAADDDMPAVKKEKQSRTRKNRVSCSQESMLDHCLY